ncbi:MAG: hypothetical protein ACTSPG_08950 [Candidatus Hodarchaeales archaeon]
MSAIGKVSHLTWRKYLKKKTPQFAGVSIISALLVLTIILSEGIDLTVDPQNLDFQHILLIIVSSLTYFILLGAILKLYLFGDLEGMGITSDENGLEIIRLSFFWGMIILFVTGLYCLLDVALQEAYLQLGPVLLIRLILDSTDTQIPGLSELQGREFYQTARNGIFAIIFFGIILFLLISLITVLTKAGRKKVFQLLQRSEKFSDLLEEQNAKSDITLLRMMLILSIPPIDFFIFSRIQDEELFIFIVGAPFLFITGIIWIYIFFKTIDDLLLKGLRIAPQIIILNILLIMPVLFCF